MTTIRTLELASPEDRQVQTAAREFLEAEALPGIDNWWESGEFPTYIVPKLGEMGFLGANLPREFGGAGVGNIAYGLVM